MKNGNDKREARMAIMIAGLTGMLIGIISSVLILFCNVSEDVDWTTVWIAIVAMVVGFVGNYFLGQLSNFGHKQKGVKTRPKKRRMLIDERLDMLMRKFRDWREMNSWYYMPINRFAGQCNDLWFQIKAFDENEDYFVNASLKAIEEYEKAFFETAEKALDVLEEAVPLLVASGANTGTASEYTVDGAALMDIEVRAAAQIIDFKQINQKALELMRKTDSNEEHWKKAEAIWENAEENEALNTPELSEVQTGAQNMEEVRNALRGLRKNFVALRRKNHGAESELTRTIGQLDLCDKQLQIFTDLKKKESEKCRECVELFFKVVQNILTNFENICNVFVEAGANLGAATKKTLDQGLLNDILDGNFEDAELLARLNRQILTATVSPNPFDHIELESSVAAFEKQAEAVRARRLIGSGGSAFISEFEKTKES